MADNISSFDYQALTSLCISGIVTSSIPSLLYLTKISLKIHHPSSVFSGNNQPVKINKTKDTVININKKIQLSLTHNTCCCNLYMAYSAC